MLRIAVQSKGRLFDDTMNLLAEADIKVSASKRTLLVQASNFPLEVLYLRDDDIPQSVASGVADIGIVGENEFVERGENAQIIDRLGFSKCRLSLAIPKKIDYPGLKWFNGKKIATSYPNILRNFMKKNNINADIHVGSQARNKTLFALGTIVEEYQSLVGVLQNYVVSCVLLLLQVQVVDVRISTNNQLFLVSNSAASSLVSLFIAATASNCHSNDHQSRHEKN